MRYGTIAALGMLTSACLMSGPGNDQPDGPTKFTVAVHGALQSSTDAGRTQNLTEARRLARLGEVDLGIDCAAVAELVAAGAHASARGGQE